MSGTTHIYDRLGVRRRINAAGPQTRLGGALMAPEVLTAMAEAAEASVDMAELQTAASDVIARITGAEAGIVTSGAAAGLTLATSACLTGFDFAKMARLPDTSGMPNEVVIARTHRTAYDHAIRAAGARLVEIGFNDRAVGSGVRGVEKWDIDAAIGPATVAIAYTAFRSSGLSLGDVVSVADRHGIPVIVDAAAQLPPVENLRRFTDEGASLVVFSGGKAIGGPQSSGVLCGRRNLIAAALLQQLDMDVDLETSALPNGLLPLGKLTGLPHHGIGRGFKTGKEEIVGLLVAIERFAGCAFEEDQQRRLQWLEEIRSRLESSLGDRVSLALVAESGAAPYLELGLSGSEARALSRTLKTGEPPIELSEVRADQGVLMIRPGALKEGDSDLIADRLTTLLSA